MAESHNDRIMVNVKRKHNNSNVLINVRYTAMSF